MNKLFAIKQKTHQAWTTLGERIPVTILRTKDNVVIVYSDQIQCLGFGKIEEKKMNKPQAGNAKKAGLSFGLRKISKIINLPEEKKSGEELLPSEVFQVGDIVDVQGISKGMGFAGGMKRHGFHGGPKTHGQSDRARAPGASSSGTTPGRVFKGKRMAGRCGNKTVTIENLQIVKLDDEQHEVWVKGVVPGALNQMVTITKVQKGTFSGLHSRTQEEQKREEHNVQEDKK